MTRSFLRALALAWVLVSPAGWSTGAWADTPYEDPAGHFSMSYVGSWKERGAGTGLRWFDYADLPLSMTVVALKADDVSEGIAQGLAMVGIDARELVESGRTIWNKWLIVSFDRGAGQGVAVLGQSRDGITVVVIGAGRRDLTNNPPQDVLTSIESIRFAGARELPETIPQFESYVAAAMASGPPGLAVELANGHEVVYAQGFGLADGPKERPASVDTVFQWGSVTKTVTATAIMQLVEQGRLDLDAPVSRYLDYVPASFPITVRHLLTHSSGLPEQPDAILKLLRLQGQDPPDLDHVLRAYFAATDELMFPPGTRSAYANPNYIVLGELVAARSGMPYEDYVRRFVLRPLGMGNTDFTYASESMRRKAAAGAIPADQEAAIAALIDKAQGAGAGAEYFRERDGSYAWFNLFNVSEGGGGGLVGPASEMIRFGQMMLNGGSLDGVRILSPGSVARLQEPQLLATGERLGIGLAWHFGGEAPYAYIEHDGGGPGLQAKLRLYMDDGLAVAMMANGAGIDRNEVAAAAANVYFALTRP